MSFQAFPVSLMRLLSSRPRGQQTRRCRTFTWHQGAMIVLAVLFEVPESLAHTVLRLWLDLVDVGRLDSAVCSSAVREKFLALAFTAPVTYLNDLANPCNSSRLISWSELRGALLDGVRIPGGFTNYEGLLTSFILRSGRRLEWIMLSGCEPTESKQKVVE